eukprot:TRINITY_DN13658_c0_g1_i4.p1 TRINITY_DN13658_c0_g1~~TRINITY_DN13658_c0_g1_i4.p1  ORF type:complete len:561 (-),score=83.36 TRINITY_DN13658_c0_g1_i4:334-1905(-)
MSFKKAKSKSKSRSRERKGQCFLCGRETSIMCTSCNQIYYCSQEHYIYHRQQNYCFPYKVVWKPGKGKCLVAARDIEAMELILFDQALVVGPRNITDQVCLECGKEVDGKYCCGICKFPMCGELCQVGKLHQMECGILARLSSNIEKTKVYPWIAPLRLLLRMAANTRVYRQVQFLMDHNTTTVDEDQTVLKENKDILTSFLKCDQLKQFTEDDFLWVKGVLRTNCIMFGEKRMRALFPHFSLINHNCRANSKHTCYIQSKKISVTAQADIKEGEEIEINYIAFIQGTFLRRKKLHAIWKFPCLCDRCKDPTELGTNLSTLRCPKCENGYLLQEDPLQDNGNWICKVHNFKISSDAYLEMTSAIKDYLYSSKAGKSIQDQEKDLEMFQEYLHPQHHLCMLLKRNIIQTYSRLDLKQVDRNGFLRIRELCQESLDILGKVDPGYPIWRADTLKDLAACEMNLARVEFEGGLIERPEFLVRVKNSMKIVEEASKCKSAVTIRRKFDNGEPLTEEQYENCGGSQQV